MPKIQRVSRLSLVPGIGVDRVGNAADALNDPEILRLENLDTDILPPHAAIIATREAIGVDANNSYLPFLGQNDLRQTVAEHVTRMSGVHYDWSRQCIITAGGCSGVLNTLLAILEPGDEVIVPDPIYAGLINRIRIAGGVPVYVPLVPTHDGWRLDVEALERSATDRTRMVLMMSPSMPTGHVLTQEEWNAIARVCIQADAWLLYDAAMERILFDGRMVLHPASLPGMNERTITVGSVSKELRMIGWRIGWVVGPESIMKDIGLVSISNVVCQIGIAMPGAAAALKNSDADVQAATDILQERRAVLMEELKGLPAVNPHGGWSLLMNTVQLGVTPQQASELLLKNAKIAATPMNGWGKQAEQYIRFVFANEPKERLRGVGQKVRNALNIK